MTFSGDEGFDRDAVHHAIERYIASTARVSLLDVMGAAPWVPRPGRLFAGGALRRTKKLADRAIAERARRGPRLPPDLLDLLRSGASDREIALRWREGMWFKPRAHGKEDADFDIEEFAQASRSMSAIGG